MRAVDELVGRAVLAGIVAAMFLLVAGLLAARAVFARLPLVGRLRVAVGIGLLVGRILALGRGPRVALALLGPLGIAARVSFPRLARFLLCLSLRLVALTLRRFALGRVALAKASARIVGLCSLETSTIACTRVGMIGSSSPTTSSLATRS